MKSPMHTPTGVMSPHPGPVPELPPCGVDPVPPRAPPPNGSPSSSLDDVAKSFGLHAPPSVTSIESSPTTLVRRCALDSARIRIVATILKRDCRVHGYLSQ